MNLTTEQITNTFTVKGFLTVMEALMVLVIVLYVVYAFILHRQIKLMNKSFSTPLAPVLANLGHFHFIFSFIIAVFAVLNLLTR